MQSSAEDADVDVKQEEQAESRGGDSMLTVIVAFTANLVIAIAKTVAALLTGSASMVAEAAHSWADTGNEIFLIIAERRGAKAPDGRHPLGFGRETYFWSTIAAFGLFTAGAVVSILHGIQQLGNPEPAGDYLIAYIVLAVAFVLEGASFLQALRQTRGQAERQGLHPLRFSSRTSNPTLRAVFAEDAAALVGLIFAGSGIALHQITGLAIFDAIGSILVGLLLAVVAVFLINRNREFLVGQQVPESTRAAMLAELLGLPGVQRVSYLYLEFVGPSRVFLVAAVDLTGDERESTSAVRVRELESLVEAREEVVEAILTLSAPDEPSLA